MGPVSSCATRKSSPAPAEIPPESFQNDLTSAIKNANDRQNIIEVQRLLSPLGAPLDHDEYSLVLPAFLLALEESHLDVVDLILTRGPGFVKYIPVDEAAVFNAHIPIIECLVKHGWDVNGDLDILGHVLGHAIDVQGEYNTDFCCWLIDHGADVNRRQGADLIRPLEIACMSNADSKLIRHLLQKGATGKSNTVLCLAAKAGNIGILRILLSEEGGMDVNAECDPSDKSYTHTITEGLPCIGLPHLAKLIVLTSC